MENSAGTNGKNRSNAAVLTESTAPEHQEAHDFVNERASGLRPAVRVPVGPSTLPPVADLSVRDTIPAPPWHDGMDDSLELVLGENEV